MHESVAGVLHGMFMNVLHGESSKRLASPRNTKDKKHLQSTQSAQPTNLTDQAPSTTERTARETHYECALIDSSTLWLLPFTLL